MITTTICQVLMIAGSVGQPDTGYPTCQLLLHGCDSLKDRYSITESLPNMSHLLPSNFKCIFITMYPALPSQLLFPIE